MSESESNGHLEDLWSKFAEKRITRKAFLQAALTAGFSLSAIGEFLTSKADAKVAIVGEPRERLGPDGAPLVVADDWNNFHNPFNQWDNWGDWRKESGGWGNNPHGGG